MADSYKKVNGRLVNNRGEWVWNGETYEYVTGHSEWLPLVFKSDNDAKKFEYLEKVWKAEQIIKYSHNKQEVMLAKEWLRNNRVQHSDMLIRRPDMSEFKYIYGESLQHWGKGKEAKDHKYVSREYKNGKWIYNYGNRSKIGDVINNITSKIADKTSEVYDSIGFDDKRHRDEAKKIYEEDKANADKKKEIYEKYKYTDKELYNDFTRLVGMSTKEQKELDKWLRDNHYPGTARDLYEKELNNSVRNWKENNPDKPALQRPIFDATSREISAKLWGDTGRKKRAQEAARTSAESSRQLKAAQLAYDKTLLGKVEKGMNLIKKLFKRK